MKIVSTNNVAYHNYFIINTLVAGIALEGSEVKSIRLGNVNLKDSFVLINKDMEVFVNNMYVKPYEKSSSYVPNERRPRKLLLNKSEIKKLYDKVKVKGFTIVPTKLFFEGSLVKLEIALAKGKHTYDKKECLKQNDIKRDMQREMKNYQ